MEKRRLVLNQNVTIKEHHDRVELILDERRIKVNLTVKAFMFLKNMLEARIVKDELDSMKNPHLKELISPLYFNDILLTEEEDELLKFGVLYNPARMQNAASPIPERRIEKWCFFGAPADFALDPPRSPAHGPYIYRKLGESHREMMDLGDIAYTTADDIYRFGKKIQHVIRRIREKNNRVMMFGGDHSLTYFVLKELSQINKDIILIQFDAHSDINTTKNKINDLLYHANFVSKLLDEKSLSGVIQIGVREQNLRYETDYLVQNTVLQLPDKLGLEEGKKIKNMINGKHVYITFDADTLDPKIFPHVTTPLDNGLSEEDVLYAVDIIRNSGCDIIGADIMEFTCGFDEKGQLFNHEISLLDRVITRIIK